jgi:penicillin-binding protein 1A
LLKKALLYALFATLALVLTACVALVLVVKLALAPGKDEWPARVQLGPVAVDVGVPTALRLATSTWFAPWLDGRSFTTEYGTVVLGWDDPNGTLEMRCAPCSAAWPALGSMPIRLDKLRVTARRDGASLSGLLEATPAGRPPTGGTGAADDGVLRGRWSGRLTQQALHLDINVPETPIPDWYAVLAPAVPELQRAHIAGTLSLGAQVGLPERSIALQPRFSQFAVEGLGTEAMAGARSACGAPSRLGSESWLSRAVVAAVDPRFFSHSGYDAGEFTTALGLDRKASQAEREATSTLTEQLAKLLAPPAPAALQPGDERLRLMLYAVEMEDTLGKARILQLYLDNAPWGNKGLCGAEAAARTYFRRGARNLEPAQAVWLAVMLQNPGASLQQWQHSGSIDPERIKSVAENMRSINKNQRDALLRSLAEARFAPP